MSLRPAPPPLRAAPAFAPAGAGNGARLDRSSRLGRVELTALAHRLGRAIRRHRRALAAVAVALAVLSALDTLRPRPDPTAQVVVAARDLAAGAALTAADLREQLLPLGAVPAGAFVTSAQLAGRHLAGPLRRGEPVTDVRLDTGLLRPPGPGLVAAPVRLADTAAAQLLQPGQHVDILAASTAVPGSGASAPALAAAAVVAADVDVLEVPPTQSGDAGAAADLGATGTLVVLATTPEQARVLAQSQVSGRLFAVVVR